MDIPDELLEKYLDKALGELPSRYIDNLDNVAITYADEPSPEQREQLRLRGDQTLFGLYEGIPLIKRGAGYNLVLPDKITIFKHPIAHYARNQEEFYRQVKHTLWHEIAHFYGLNHDRIEQIERAWND